MSASSVQVNSEKVKDMVANCELSIIRKPQKEAGNYNYYFTPNMTVKLYNAKVIVSDPKFLVLQFTKSSSLNLLIMLRSINASLTSYLRRCYVIDEDKMLYPCFSEQEDTFTIRCYLPHIRNKYFITTEFDGVESKFVLPRPNNILSCVTVEYRNIWESTDKLGFNMEVKVIKH